MLAIVSRGWVFAGLALVARLHKAFSCVFFLPSYCALMKLRKKVKEETKTKRRCYEVG